MSESTQQRPSESLLYSDLLFRVLGGDAMQILRCGICMEFFDVPIVLPCGHTFCLQCLTEMCKHASRNCVLSPLKDLRIGCPNCRVLIYASPILERNVTCNFIIQSLIECLRAREGGRRVSIGVNTEEVRLGPKIRSVGDLEMEKAIKEVDRMTDAIGRRNVLDNAYFEVDEIRRQHLAKEARRQEEEEEQQQQQQKAWSQNRSIQPYSFQLRLHQQQQKQQQQQQQQLQQQQQQIQRSRAFSWEDLNNQIMTLTPSMSFYHQQANLQQHYKLHQLQPQQLQQQQPQSQQQQQQQQQPPQQQTSHYQLRVHQQQQQHHSQQQQQPPPPPPPPPPPLQPQAQQPGQSTLSKISKMATVLPLPRCLEAGQFPGTSSQFDLSPGQPSRLDNDPAIMSYSYKAAIAPMGNTGK